MSDVAILTDQISKRFQIGARQKGYLTLREQINGLFSAPWRRMVAVARRGSDKEYENSFWALKDVSFEVKSGDVVGIIGRNGSGKSTLLKILSRITEPTEGTAEIHGRVASLLEVGTGFHPELTGRENIYLNGAILGMSRTEIARRFDEIVDFAEVEKFIETPVKRYSSGMYLRLAFAVAAHLEPEILLVDEVLAVGDAAFQKKCLGKMGEVAKQGRTVLLVSHNMAAIARLSNSCIWLDNGRLAGHGHPEEVISDYLASGVNELGEVIFPVQTQDSSGSTQPYSSENIRPLAVRIRNEDGVITPTLDIRLPFTIEFEYQVLKRTENLRVGLTLIGQDGTVILSTKDTDHANEETVRDPGSYLGRCTLPGEFLNAGQYFVSIGSDIPMRKNNFYIDRALAFHIEQTGGAGGHLSDKRKGLLRVRFPWDVQRIDNGFQAHAAVELEHLR